jgi:uncharacterized membrane protein YcaP (DUF421 family)
MEQDYTPFDLQRMFLGDDYALLLLLEIGVRTAIMYLAALLLGRFLGKRGLGQLSPFEYLLVIAAGSAVGDPMLYFDVPLLHGILVLAGLVLCERALTALAERSKSAERFIESVPALLVRDGTVLETNLKREGLARDELYGKLRESGVSNLSQVRLAYLEPSGRFSVFRRSDDLMTVREGSTLPADEGERDTAPPP